MGKEIKQVIVVEGKSDTQKLQKIYGKEIKTIETNGLKFNPKLFTFLNQVNSERGIIVFTDPDGPGKIIREKINQKLDGSVLNAFITKKDIHQNSKKIGIAEANDQAIVEALKKIIVFDSHQTSLSLSWIDYLNNDFYLKKNRQKIAQNFGWSDELSSKTMYKWLIWSGVTATEIKKILESYDNGN